MTDTEKSSATSTPASDAGFNVAHTQFLKNRRRFSLVTVILPLIIMLGIYGGYLILQIHLMSGATVTPSSTAAVVQLEQRLAANEEKLQAMEARINQLEGRPVQATATPAPPPVDTQATAQLQNDFTALSATVSALQAGMKQAGAAATEIWQTTQGRINTSVAFIQLRADADAGRGFASDLAALRGAAPGDTVVQASVTQLDPYAAVGAPPLATLREEFERLEGPVSIAVDKATARDWRARLLADIKELVLIRPLHGAPVPDALSSIETALTANDLPAALEAVKQLPQAAQDVLKDWRAQAEARVNIDHTLQALADHVLQPALSPTTTRTEP